MIAIHCGGNSILHHVSCHNIKCVGSSSLRVNSAELCPKIKGPMRYFVLRTQNFYKEPLIPNLRNLRTPAISLTHAFLLPQLENIKDWWTKLSHRWTPLTPAGPDTQFRHLSTVSQQLLSKHLQCSQTSTPTLNCFIQGNMSWEGKGPFKSHLLPSSCLNKGLSQSYVPGSCSLCCSCWLLVCSLSFVPLLFGLALWPANTLVFFSSSTT